MDHADYLMMRAPTAILMCVATKDFFDIQGAWTSFRYAKRLYTRLGVPERISLLENDAEHNYNAVQRQGIVRWMARWLLGNDKPITEPNDRAAQGRRVPLHARRPGDAPRRGTLHLRPEPRLREGTGRAAKGSLGQDAPCGPAQSGPSDRGHSTSRRVAGAQVEEHRPAYPATMSGRNLAVVPEERDTPLPRGNSVPCGKSPRGPCCISMRTAKRRMPDRAVRSRNSWPPAGSWSRWTCAVSAKRNRNAAGATCSAPTPKTSSPPIFSADPTSACEPKTS